MLLTPGAGYTPLDARETYVFGRSPWYAGNQAGPPPIVAHHGAQNTYGTSEGLISPQFQAHTRALLKRCAEEGWPFISCDFGYQVDLFSNDGDIARCFDAGDHVTASRTAGGLGARPGPKVRWGVSMGGGASMATAREDPADTLALVVMIPMCDPVDAATKAGVLPHLNAAYPGGVYDRARDDPTHAAIAFADQLAGIPTFFVYATDDEAIDPVGARAVADMIGPSCEVHTVTGGHSDASIAKVNPDDVIDFLRRHAPLGS